MTRPSAARHLRRALAGAASLGAAAAIAAPSASAAPVDLAGGVTNLHLNTRTAAALGDLGLSVAPVGPATARGTRVSFPITGGAIEPDTAAGTVTHSGGLAFSAGGTTVRVTNFTVETSGKTPVLIASAGKARIPLLDLDLSRAKVIRRGPGQVGTWVVRVNTSLTTTAAKALNAAFGSHLAAGTPIGRVDVRSTPAEVNLDGGATTLSLDPTTAAALAGLGVTPSVIAPGSAGAGGLAFPVTGGTLAAGTFAGRIDHSGGIALSAASTRVELTSFRITVDSNPELTAVVNGGSIRVPLAVDLGAAKTGLSAGKAVVRNAKVSLTQDAAAALNAAFKTSALKAGLALGTADVRAEVE